MLQKEILEEDLKEKNKQEAMLLTSRKMLEREHEPSSSGVDILDDDKVKDSGVGYRQGSTVSIIEVRNSCH